MREIKFRGKSTQDKQWIYGSLTVYPFDESFIISQGVGIKVYNETVGQFTGKHDKNGNEIYEGHITEEKHFRNRRIVTWHLNGWYLKDVNQEYYTPLIDGDYEIVVGNKFENPELVEVK